MRRPEGPHMCGPGQGRMRPCREGRMRPSTKTTTTDGRTAISREQLRGARGGAAGDGMSSHPAANVSYEGEQQMITLNRLGHSDEPFQLNPDMIVTVESTPDTVITLATGAKVVVAETPADVAAAVHGYRAEVLSEAFRRRGA